MALQQAGSGSKILRVNVQSENRQDPGIIGLHHLEIVDLRSSDR